VDLAATAVEEYRRGLLFSGLLRPVFLPPSTGGETRSVSHYEPYPVMLAEGHGALVRDMDATSIHRRAEQLHVPSFTVMALSPDHRGRKAVLPTARSFGSTEALLNSLDADRALPSVGGG